MRLLTLEQQKSIQLGILDAVDSYCRSESLSYSLCGGTMIGAVRHKGYIPWDDDIDLMMPRPDYDRFIKEFSHPDYYILNLAEKNYCVEQFVKVCRNGTVMEDILLKRHMWGVNIDIFPVDGLPLEYQPYTQHLRLLHSKVELFCPYYKVVSGTKKITWFIKYCVKRLTRLSFRSIHSLKKELDCLAHEHLPQDSPLATVVYGDFAIHPFPSEMFQHYENVLFEGKMRLCIVDRDSYLSEVYGNYMMLPPVEKQVSHHLYDSYPLDDRQFASMK